jgi:phage shock protein E
MNLQELLEQPNTTFVDVRSAEEFAREHITGAVNIPLHTIPYRVDEFKAMPQPILCYCRSGARSGQAVGFLKQEGITEVYNGGGIDNLYQLQSIKQEA